MWGGLVMSLLRLREVVEGEYKGFGVLWEEVAFCVEGEACVGWGVG